MPGVGLTVFTVAEDREVMKVGVKAVGVSEVVKHRRHLCEGDQGGLFADFTDEVLMVLVDGEMPPAGLIPEMDVVNKSDTGKFVECPVDGGGVDLAG